MEPTQYANRRSISTRLKSATLCAIASLLIASLAIPLIAFAGIAPEVEVPSANNPKTQFLYPPQNVYVLAIGINKYKNPDVNLQSSVQDATYVAKNFQAMFSFSGTVFNIVLLTDDQATKEGIRQAIQQIALKSRGPDIFILTFSGHAFAKTKNGNQEGYLLGADAVWPPGCKSGTECIDDSTLISGTLLNSWMTQMHAQRQIILLDSSNTDRLIPIFENHWRKESCSVGPEASKRILIVANHGDGLETDKYGGMLTFAFVNQLGRQRINNGINSAFRLQQGIYSMLDPDPADEQILRGTKETLLYQGWGFRAELLGGDFLIDGPRAGVKNTDLLRDSGLGALCYNDSSGTTRGGLPEDKPAADSTPKSDQPTNYALVIASDHYKNWHELSNPIFDASTIEKDLASTYGFKVEHLWDPTRDQLRDKLNELHKRHFNHGDQLFIFIAGHGDYDETNDIGYLVFADTPAGHAYDNELNLQELRSRIDTIPVDHTFLVMDSCFAGSLDPPFGGGGRGDYDPIPLEKLQQRSADKKTRYFLTSGGKEYVPDGTPGNHSPFASLFILALEKGTAKTGFLNLPELAPYFQRMATTPRAGNLGHNEDGADFFFIPAAATPPAPE